MKPEKPFPDFPLFPHTVGQWAKKIKGRMHYFGVWADPPAALDNYLKVKDDLHAGRVPRPDAQAVTLKYLIGSFLQAKEALVKSGEITARTYTDYYTSAHKFLKHLHDRLVTDIRPDDFSNYRKHLAKTLGHVALANAIQRVRTIFKYGFDEELLDRPVRFGANFKKPSRKTIRIRRNQASLDHGKRMFEPGQLHSLIGAAGLPMRAMILLGINCGFGNNDCATLPRAALDLETGWIEFPRPKTGIQRRCKLWPETVQALQEWLPRRPNPKNPEHDKLVFVTKPGGIFQQALASKKQAIDSPISKEFAKLLRKLKMKRPGLNFYALRHTFETVAGECKDQVAVDYIMGHAQEDMASKYREQISDRRLEEAVALVRSWLYRGSSPSPSAAAAAAGARQQEPEPTAAQEMSQEPTDAPRTEPVCS